MRWYVTAFVAILLGLCQVSLSAKAYIFDGEYYDQESNKWPLVEQSVPWNDLEISDESDQKKFNFPINPNSNFWLFNTKGRSKRQNNNRPMLSILNPLDVLRQRLMLEMDRRRTQQQINQNKALLEQVGKRKKRSLFMLDHLSNRVESAKSDPVERSENSIRAA